MDMNDMLEITHLVRSGAVMEATAKIQRALHGIPPPATTLGASDTMANAPIIEAAFRVIDDGSVLSTDTPLASQRRPHNP